MISDKRLNKTTKSLKKIAIKATKIYKNKKFKEEYEHHKFENDDVTNLDIKTQAFIKAQCKKIMPEASFVGEEGGTNSDSDYSFIVDPIDGTFNFKRNILSFGTQLALAKKGTPIISVLYLPNSKQMFFANKHGAFENSMPIKVSNESNLKNAVIAVGDFVEELGNISQQQKIIKLLSSKVKRVRMLGSSCVDNCMVSSGRVDAYIIFSSNVWDLLPGQFLVKQAGGKVVSNKESNIYISGNPKIVDKLSELILID